MDAPLASPAKRRRAAYPFLRIACLLSLLLAISSSLAYLIDRWRTRNDEARRELETLTNRPGIQQPTTYRAASVRLADEAEVIGVLIEGRPRAYEVQAFSALPFGDYSRHVVNDVLAGVPITVSYCDRLNCTRVYTEAHAKTPLPIGVWRFYEAWRTTEPAVEHWSRTLSAGHRGGARGRCPALPVHAAQLRADDLEAMANSPSRHRRLSPRPLDE
jgi:hypothetical protein